MKKSSKLIACMMTLAMTMGSFTGCGSDGKTAEKENDTAEAATAAGSRLRERDRS